MPAPPIRLGVDLGTSNTVAVVRWPDGRARPLLFDGSPLLPSAVYAERGGALVVGRDAVHSARIDPSRFEPNPKRRIDDEMVLLGDREIPVGELLSAVLARVAEEWQRTAGDAAVANPANANPANAHPANAHRANGEAGGNGRVPAEITVTCPATWGATRRLVLADAARAAGLGDVRMVVEPVAAATYFAQVLGRDVPIGSVVVVHDFGAGTFDSSVVARTSSGFEVLAVDGRDDIGGLDVDQAVIKHIGTVCAHHDPAAWQRLVNPETVEDRRARRLLWDDARIAKERLSRGTTADLTVPLVGVDVHLTREELEGLARPLIDATTRVTLGVMRWSRIVDGRLAGVFLVGGSSRIPLVATALHRAIGEAPVVIEQPELVVAEGSVLAGAVAVPVSAAPAPGPATGEQPIVPASWAVRAEPAASTVRVSVSSTGVRIPSAAAATTVAVPTLARPPVVYGQAASVRDARYAEYDQEPAWDGRPEPPGRRSGGVARFVRITLLTILLVAVPVLSAYAAYRITLRFGS